MDDKTIFDDWRLLRRIPAERGASQHLVWDDNQGRWRISSAAFSGHRDNRKAFSVHLEPVLTEQGLDARAVQIDPAKYAVAALVAGAVRAIRPAQALERHPTVDDRAHAHVVGEKTGAVRRAMAEMAVWVIEPLDWPWAAP